MARSQEELDSELAMENLIRQIIAELKGIREALEKIADRTG